MSLVFDQCVYNVHNYYEWSDWWDILLDEAERFRLYLSSMQTTSMYGGFHGEKLSFPDDNLNFTLPKSLSGIDILLHSTSRDAEKGEPCPISCTILPR